MTFHPLANRVLIRPIPAENISAGGIYLPPSNSQDPIAKGVVVAVGLKVESELEVGDKVLYSSTAGSEITVDSEELRVMEEVYVHAVI